MDYFSPNHTNQSPAVHFIGNLPISGVNPPNDATGGRQRLRPTYFSYIFPAARQEEAGKYSFHCRLWTFYRVHRGI